MEEVKTVKYEMEVPKEGKEVVDLMDKVLENVMEKKGLAEYADLLDDLMVAVDGVGGVVKEAKSQYRDELAGYLVHKLMSRLMPVK